MGWTNPNTQVVQPITLQGSLAGGSVVTTLVGATGQYVTGLIDVSNYASYDLAFYIYGTASPVSTSPMTASVQLYWYDDPTSGIITFEEDWWVWVGQGPAGNPDTLTATGPMHGRYMQIWMMNAIGSTTNTTLQYLYLFGSPRVQTFSDWRQDAQEVSPISNVATRVDPVYPGSPGGFGWDNILANMAQSSLSASTVYFTPFHLYAGPVYWSFGLSVSPANAPNVAIAGNLLAGGIVSGAGGPDYVVAQLPVSTVTSTGQFYAPRSPGMFVFKTGASATFAEGVVLGQQNA